MRPRSGRPKCAGGLIRPGLRRFRVDAAAVGGAVWKLEGEIVRLRRLGLAPDAAGLNFRRESLAYRRLGDKRVEWPAIVRELVGVVREL